jgi:23S rRNA pseudouridine1911/1915/1917 synthase
VTFDPAPLRLHRFVADRGDAHQRVDLVVMRRVPADARVSRTLVQRAVTAHVVAIDGRIAPRASARVLEGQVVEAWLPEPPPRQRPRPEVAALAICYEDDHLLIVDKPAGMVVHPTYKHAGGTMLNALLGRASGADAPWTPALVHRLDKDTSGLLLVAKDRDVLLALQRQWAARGVVKRYAALTLGRPPRRSGSVTLKLRRDPLDRRRMVASPTLGQDSLTRYEIAASSRGSRRGVALVMCELGTGRLHQIRVHLSAIGAPIVGDPVYGPARFTGLTDLRLVAALKGMRRQALHACQLVFVHPVTGRRVDARAPLPPDISALLTAAGIEPPSLERASAR